MEGNVVHRKIGDFHGQFQLVEQIIYARLKSNMLPYILVVNINSENMPDCFQYLKITLADLFNIFGKLQNESIKVSEKEELVLVLNFFGLIREFPLQMERENMNSEELLKENIEMRKNIAELNTIFAKLEEKSKQNEQLIAQLKEENIKEKHQTQKFRCKNKELKTQLEGMNGKIQYYEEEMIYLSNTLQNSEKKWQKSQQKAKQLEMKLADGTGSINKNTFSKNGGEPEITHVDKPSMYGYASGSLYNSSLNNSSSCFYSKDSYEGSNSYSSSGYHGYTVKAKPTTSTSKASIFGGAWGNGNVFGKKQSLIKADNSESKSKSKKKSWSKSNSKSKKSRSKSKSK